MNLAETLEKAIQYDLVGRRIEALKLYESGIAQLLQKIKDISNAEQKERYHQKVKEYLARAEAIKQQISQMASKGDLIDKIFIMEDAIGFSYNRIFGKYLTDSVNEVWLEEPYLVEYYQLCNLVQFCELLVSKCKNLRFINVTTAKKKDKSNDQNQAFESLVNDLKGKNITLNIDFNEHTHDRQIILNNGHIIKIGRGLNYFKATANKFNLGMFDYNFRPCRQTNVDIFFCSEIKN